MGGAVMSLHMYLGETDEQKSSMNTMCVQMILAMESMQASIHLFRWNSSLQGQTYSSAKSYMVRYFLPLTRGVIYLCEELIRQNDRYPKDFRAEVSTTDVVEEEILAQIEEIDQMIARFQDFDKASLLFDVRISIYEQMKRTLQEKLLNLRMFNVTSGDNYTIAMHLAASVMEGLSQIQDHAVFDKTTGTFKTDGVHMDWINNLEESQREAIVAEYEYEHPEDAQKVTEFLSPLEERDSKEIKYLMYTADEPYRTIAMEYVDRLEIVSTTESGVFYPSTNEMRFDVAKDRKNKRGQYFTFFHELGHAIDYNYGVEHGMDGYFSSVYKTGGKTLAGHMHADVKHRLQLELHEELMKKPYEKWSGFEKNIAIARVVDAFVYDGPKDIDLTEKQEVLYDKVQKKVSSELYTDVDHNVSDIYGGVTINEVVGKWSHPKREYWIDTSDGERIREPSGEGFASYFGTLMIGKGTFRSEQIESLEMYIPSSHAHMDKMFEEMKKGEDT